MRRVIAKFEITTPMFLGGADNSQTVELKPTSVKGVLRFWFRAVNYGKNQDFKKVKKVEDKLRTQDLVEETKSVVEELFKELGISYLGYGLDYGQGERDEKGRKRKVNRPCLRPKQTFSLELLLNPRISDEISIENLIMPVKALGLFGGLGSRSRRGFGSVTLNSICIDGNEHWAKPKTRSDLLTAYKDFYSFLELGDPLPEYTAFSKNNKTIVLKESNSYKNALQEVGSALMGFRRDCRSDAKIISNYLKNVEVEEHPRRIVFGLPHNYFIRSVGKVEINPIMGGGTRRASPLFIKIISIKENGYIPVLTLFPAIFLPEGGKIRLKGERKRERDLTPQISYDLIADFMKGCVENMDALEVTPNG